MMSNWLRSHRQFVIAFSMLSFAVHLLMPVGWMPSVDRAGMTLITLCSGTGAHEAWIDANGTLQHKANPAAKHHEDHPCAFSGIGVALDTLGLPFVEAPLVPEAQVVSLTPATVSIGRGLVAPPPPATGPPSLI